MKGDMREKYEPGVMRPKYGVGDLTEVMIKYGFGLEPGPDMPKPTPEKKKYYVLPKNKISAFQSLEEAQQAAKKVKSKNYAIICDDDKRIDNKYHLVKDSKFKGYDTLDEAIAILYTRKDRPLVVYGIIVDASVLNVLNRMDLKREMGIK